MIGKLLIAALMLFAMAGAASAADPDPRGLWLTEGGKSRVEIADCDGSLCGRIVWLREPNNEDGTPKLDVDNEDESLRDRPIVGLKVLWGFSHDGDGEWSGGRIYNPEDGYTYRSRMEVVDSKTLEVSGCVLFVLCQGQTWVRVQ